MLTGASSIATIKCTVKSFAPIKNEANPSKHGPPGWPQLDLAGMRPSPEMMIKHTMHTPLAMRRLPNIRIQKARAEADYLAKMNIHF